jgi:hypothetical protein
MTSPSAGSAGCRSEWGDQQELKRAADSNLGSISSKIRQGTGAIEAFRNGDSQASGAADALGVLAADSRYEVTA